MVEEQKVEEKAKVSPQSNLKVFAYGLVGILVLAVLIIGGVTVKAVNSLSQNSFVLKVAKVLDLPAAKINGMKVSYNDYVDDLNTLNKFYTNTPDTPAPTAEQVSDQVLSRLLANKLIGKIATSYDVKVTDEDMAEFKKNLIAQFETEAKAEEELMTKYGWTLDKYMERVVGPILVEQKLQQAFNETTTVNADDKFKQEQVQARHILFAVKDEAERAAVKTEAEKVLQELKAGGDFAKLAAQYSADTANKDNGGDLGWFGKGQMVPEFENAVFALEPSQMSENLVETSYGFHIVKVEGKRTVKDYFAFMDDQFKNADIKIVIKAHNPFEQLQQQANVQVDTETIDAPVVEVNTEEPVEVKN
ncbi:MAG: peptidylprolyl isomerase [Candidatus Magasanikiibacteriota bacterium]